MRNCKHVGTVDDNRAYVTRKTMANEAKFKFSLEDLHNMKQHITDNIEDTIKREAALDVIEIEIRRKQHES